MILKLCSKQSNQNTSITNVYCTHPTTNIMHQVKIVQRYETCKVFDSCQGSDHLAVPRLEPVQVRYSRRFAHPTDVIS